MSAGEEVFEFDDDDTPFDMDEDAANEDIDDPSSLNFGQPSLAFDDDLDSSGLGSLYRVLSEREVLLDCEKKIQEVRDVCDVPTSTAAGLLQQFKWNPETVIVRWLEDPEATLKKAGLSRAAAAKANSEPTGVLKNMLSRPPKGHAQCHICYEIVKKELTLALECHHPYCLGCWREYLSLKVRDGPACVQARCMYPDCSQLVHDGIYEKVVTPEELERYKDFLHRSFVTKNETMKWCPAPNCTNAICSEKKVATVSCTCGFSFCFRCSDYDVGDHMPATCKMVTDWLAKAVDESENVKWMMVNTKNCPSCSMPIEKNGGCMHMTCQKALGGCGHEFCWLCRGPWKDHGSHTGGYYSCNKFEATKKKDEEDKVQNAKTELERYMFHFHRYDAHRSARKIASQQLQQAEAKGAKMQELLNLRTADTAFLIEATKQLLRNRRALEFSYVYGYYFDKGEQERSLFLYLQEDLEKHTGALSELYERQIEAICDYNSFCKWKEDVSNYTSVIKKFLDNFVEGVSQGLTNM